MEAVHSFYDLIPFSTKSIFTPRLALAQEHAPGLVGHVPRQAARRVRDTVLLEAVEYRRGIL